MKRYLLITVLLLGWAMNLFPCADYEESTIISHNDLFPEAVPYEDGFDYLIENEECRDFQYFYNHYCFGCHKRKPNSGNMEEWAKYLKIDEEQAYYLVNKVPQQAIDSLLVYGLSNDPRLKFADKAFCKKWRNALTYISFAKYLEPYMARENGDDYDLWQYPYDTEWYEPRRPSILNLDYTTVLNNMIEAYDRQKDKKHRDLIYLIHEYKRAYTCYTSEKGAEHESETARDQEHLPGRAAAVGELVGIRRHIRHDTRQPFSHARSPPL